MGDRARPDVIAEGGEFEFVDEADGAAGGLDGDGGTGARDAFAAAGEPRGGGLDGCDAFEPFDAVVDVDVASVEDEIDAPEGLDDLWRGCGAHGGDVGVGDEAEFHWCRVARGVARWGFIGGFCRKDA